VPIASGDELVGAVLLLGPASASEAAEFLHLAAVASLTEVAVEEAKEEVEQNLRGSFLEDLRSRPELEPREIVRRAGRLGCDLSRGAVVLCAELSTDRPRHVVATIAGEYPGALEIVTSAQAVDGGAGDHGELRQGGVLTVVVYAAEAVLIGGVTRADERFSHVDIVPGKNAGSNASQSMHPVPRDPRALR
jgi:hypothetical protein